MVINDLNKELDMLIKAEGITVAAIAEKFGIHPNNLYRYIKTVSIIDKRYPVILEMLGYDIVVSYKKRAEGPTIEGAFPPDKLNFV